VPPKKKKKKNQEEKDTRNFWKTSKSQKFNLLSDSKRKNGLRATEKTNRTKLLFLTESTSHPAAFKDNF
jgi:hypothetical protein